MKVSNEFYNKITPLIDCGADCNELDEFKNAILPEIELMEKHNEKLLEIVVRYINIYCYRCPENYEEVTERTCSGCGVYDNIKKVEEIAGVSWKVLNNKQGE